MSIVRRSRVVLPELVAINTVAWFIFAIAKGLPDQFSRKSVMYACEAAGAPFLEGSYDIDWGWNPPGFHCVFNSVGGVAYHEPTWSGLRSYGLAAVIMAIFAVGATAALVRYGYPSRKRGLLTSSLIAVLLPPIALLGLAATMLAFG